MSSVGVHFVKYIEMYALFPLINYHIYRVMYTPRVHYIQYSYSFPLKTVDYKKNTPPSRRQSILSKFSVVPVTRCTKLPFFPTYHILSILWDRDICLSNVQPFPYNPYLFTGMFKVRHRNS